MKFKHRLILLINKLYFFKRLFRKFINPTNTVVLIKQNGKRIYNPKIKNLECIFMGSNNYVEITEPLRIETKFTIKCTGSHSTVKIGKSNVYTNCTILLRNRANVEIGDYTTWGGGTIITADNSAVKIGSDCMFSNMIEIRVTDGHTLYDRDSKKLINDNKDITIGNHVWIGTRALLLKSNIADNNIIGACSFVNKDFNIHNCVIAGTPAKVVKTNVNWDRRTPTTYQ